MRAETMRCDVCGAPMHEAVADLPFKLGPTSTVTVRQVPPLECRSCPAYLLRDEVFVAVDALLASVDRSSELEVIQFAA